MAHLAQLDDLLLALDPALPQRWHHDPPVSHSCLGAFQPKCYKDKDFQHLSPLQLFELLFDAYTKRRLLEVLSPRVRTAEQVDHYLLRELEQSTLRRASRDFAHLLVQLAIPTLDLAPVYSALNSLLTFRLYDHVNEYLAVFALHGAYYALCDPCSGFILRVFHRDHVLPTLAAYRHEAYKVLLDPALATLDLAESLASLGIGALALLPLAQGGLTLRDAQHLRANSDHPVAFYAGSLTLTYFVQDHQFLGVLTNFPAPPSPYLVYQHFSQNVPALRKQFRRQLSTAKSPLNQLQLFIQAICINCKAFKNTSLFRFKSALIHQLRAKLHLKALDANHLPPIKHSLISSQLRFRCTQCGAWSHSICEHCTSLLDLPVGLCSHDPCVQKHIAGGELLPKMDALIQKAVGSRKGIASAWARLKTVKQKKEREEEDMHAIRQEIANYEEAILLLTQTLAEKQYAQESIPRLLRRLNDLILDAKQLKQSDEAKSQNESQLDLGCAFNSDSESQQ